MLDYLLTRTSPSAKELTLPGPDPDQIETIVTVAKRVPDHKKLSPFSVLTYSGDARETLATLAREGYRLEQDEAAPAEKLEIEAQKFYRAPCVFVVVYTPKESKIPEIEQVLCAGAGCMNLIHAVNALGFGCQWLTGWSAFSPYMIEGLGFDPAKDTIAGFIHVGTQQPTDI